MWALRLRIVRPACARLPRDMSDPDEVARTLVHNRAQDCAAHAREMYVVRLAILALLWGCAVMIGGAIAS